MLPGGGQEVGESAEQAAVREVEEECGLRIALNGWVGIADELVFGSEEQKHYRKRCTFFLAEVIGRSGPGEKDHQLVWLPRGRAAAILQHESQRWAVSRCG